MRVNVVRRLTGSFLATSVALMALSACASGPMTMAEMVCCAEHHDDCEMAGQAESCCASDLQSDMGVLATERTDTAHVADVASQLVDLPERRGGTLAVLDAVRFAQNVSVLDIRSRPSPLSAVLLI